VVQPQGNSQTMKMIIGRNESRGLPLIIIILAVILVVCFVVSQWFENSQKGGEIEWLSIEETATTERMLFVDVTSDRCAPCKAMEDYTFSNKSLASLIQHNFVPVRVEGEDPVGMNFCVEYDIKAFPTILVLSPTREEITRFVGFLTADQLTQELEQVLQDITDYEHPPYNPE
jgi:thiol:disulfide interchange protein